MLIINLFIAFLFLQAEVNYLGQLSHPNLVKLIGYCCEDEHRLLVYEYMASGSLEKHLFRSKLLIPLLLYGFSEGSRIYVNLVALKDCDVIDRFSKQKAYAILTIF